MIRRLLPILALAFASVSHLHAGDAAMPAAPADTSAELSTPAPSNVKTSYEIDADNSYVGGARTNLGDGTRGNVSEFETSEKLLIEPQINDGPIYRFGLAYQRYNFGLSKAAPFPDILEAENLVLGLDFSLFNSWLVRVEVDPGFYGDGRDYGFRSFNAPIIVGGSYIASDTLQWIAGFDVDFNRQIPIFPAVGMRWAVSDSFVIDAVLPQPRLEYNYSKAVTLYMGGDVDDGTYRVDHGVGAALGQKKLSNSVVEYDEIRVGAGLSWKASKAFTFELEAGYLPYREFDFHRADTHYSNDDGAAYGRMSLNAQF